MTADFNLHTKSSGESYLTVTFEVCKDVCGLKDFGYKNLHEREIPYTHGKYMLHALDYQMYTTCIQNQ